MLSTLRQDNAGHPQQNAERLTARNSNAAQSQSIPEEAETKPAGLQFPMLYTNFDSRLRSHPRLLAKTFRAKAPQSKTAIPRKKPAARTALRIAPSLRAIALLLAFAASGSAQEAVTRASETASRWPDGGLSPITVGVLGFGVCAALYGTIRSICEAPDHLYSEKRDSNSEQMGRNPKRAGILESSDAQGSMKPLNAQTFDRLLKFKDWRRKMQQGVPVATNSTVVKSLPVAKVALVAFLFIAISAAWTPTRAAGADLGAIKTYLVTKVTAMDKASHDYVAHATAYEKIVQSNGGDYDQAVLKDGDTLVGLVAKMQGDYRVIHNNGYETIEGITAGTKRFVQFDNDLDAGVPKSEATTDTPASQLVLKTDSGKTIIDRNGNLFHYVMEPALWGTKAVFIVQLSAEASAKVHGVKVLPRAEVLTSSAKECARRMDQLLALSQSWQPTLDEVVGALVWMTPTLNGYFEDWKDSRYNPNAALGRYVAESRVIDMRGIMSSLQLTYASVMPEVAKKDAALAKRLQSDYAGIMGFLNHVDEREKKGSKLTILEIEEMAYQAKALTDQLVPRLKQVVALLGLKLPPKPVLA